MLVVFVEAGFGRFGHDHFFGLIHGLQRCFECGLKLFHPVVFVRRQALQSRFLLTIAYWAGYFRAESPRYYWEQVQVNWFWRNLGSGSTVRRFAPTTAPAFWTGREHNHAPSATSKPENCESRRCPGVR